MSQETVQADNEVIKSLQVKVTEANLRIQQLEKELAAAHKVNGEFAKEIDSLSAKSDNAVIAPHFEKDGETYGFNFLKMQHNLKPITHEDVIADAGLQQELIEMGSGMIHKK